MSRIYQPKITEPSFNVELGNVLRQKHPRWRRHIDVEQTGALMEGRGLQPDLIVRPPGGIPVAIETEYAPARTVESDALKRLGNRLQDYGRPIEQSFAFRIPQQLSRAGQYNLQEEITKASFEFCIFSGFSPENPHRWPESGWIEGGIDHFAACIEQAAMSETQTKRGLEILETGISQAAKILREACADAPAPLNEIAEGLHQKDSDQTTRMAMAIVANAMTFHTAISGSENDDGSFVVGTLDSLRNEAGALPKQKLLQHWRDICHQINYLPIFKIASEVLTPIPNGTAQSVLERLSQVSSSLAAIGAASQQDLSGRMFQRLITDRKFLATFYTLPVSAALLAELALARLDLDWSDKEAICSLRIADFACGTGALLNAAYQSVRSRYRRKGGDDRNLHVAMMESALLGTDIMPAAAHLTVSVLSSAHPEVPFADTAIITLPYGEQPGRSDAVLSLGALDLIEDEGTLPLPLFGTGQQRLSGSAGGKQQVDIPHGSFDLVIMNPPFTRPTKHTVADVPVPSFAGFGKGKDEQKAMSRKLKRIRKPYMAGHGNAGLASNFMDIAHAKLKPGGVLALVLPAAFSQGDAWANARQMLQDHYMNVTIISIAATSARDCAFSADTGMAEVLVIATRRKDSDKANGKVLFINLFQRPGSILESVAVASAIRQAPPPLPNLWACIHRKRGAFWALYFGYFCRGGKCRFAFARNSENDGRFGSGQIESSAFAGFHPSSCMQIG